MPGGQLRDFDIDMLIGNLFGRIAFFLILRSTLISKKRLCCQRTYQKKCRDFSHSVSSIIDSRGLRFGLPLIFPCRKENTIVNTEKIRLTR